MPVTSIGQQGEYGGLSAEDRTVHILVRRSGAREADHLGRRVESGRAAAPARDEGGRAPGDLPHRRRKERGGNGDGRVGGRVGRAQSAGEDQGREGDQEAGVPGGGKGESAVRRFAAGAAGKAVGRAVE